MKEKKVFFTRNNRLNKGYRVDNKKSKTYINENIKKILPPIEVLEAYEEVCPGALDKLIQMARQEQQHSHALDRAYIRIHRNIGVLGKLCNILIVIAVSSITLKLISYNMAIHGMVFAGTAFFLVMLISMYLNKGKLCQNKKNNA